MSNRLLIISHTPHYRRDGGVVGWGPTVRELDYLADLFDEVVHLAPLYDEPAPDSALAYAAGNIRLRSVEPAGGPGLANKVGILTAYPAYARIMRDEMDASDFVHVRCPANISLLALYLLGSQSHPRPRWVKYAGNWQPEGGEPRTYALQRRWLRNNRPRAVVTVNGRWPDQPAHVHSFYNPSLTDGELVEGRQAAATKKLTWPLELLFVGALNDGKGVGRVLEVALALQQHDLSCRLRLLGDGPDRPRYEAWVAEHGLNDVTFFGWVPREDVAEHYAAAHFILLPSQTEGWPKVLSEAMAYGVVPVAAAVSSIPQILAETGAGVAVVPDDIAGQVAVIEKMAVNPTLWETASQSGVAAAELFTYRHYQEAVADLFAQHWSVQLSLPEGSAAPRFETPLTVPDAPGLNGDRHAGAAKLPGEER